MTKRADGGRLAKLAVLAGGLAAAAAGFAYLSVLPGITGAAAIAFAALAAGSGFGAALAQKRSAAALTAIEADIAALKAKGTEAHLHAPLLKEAVGSVLKGAEERAGEAAVLAEASAAQAKEASAVLALTDKAVARAVFSGEGKLLEAGRGFLSLTGYDEEEAKTLRWDEFCADADTFWNEMAGGEEAAGTIKLLRKDGTAVEVEASGADADGRIAVCFQDFSTLKNAEAAASKAEARFQNAPTATLVLDPEGRMVAANRAMRVMTKEHRELASRWPAVAARGAGEEMHLFGRDMAEQRRAFADRAKLPLSISVTSGDRAVELTVSGVWSADGSHGGNVAEWREVTEEAARERLLEAVDRNQGLIEFSPDGTVLSANDIILGWFGYAREEVVGKPHSLLAGRGEAATSSYTEFWAKLRSGTPQSGTFRRFAKDGEVVWLHATYMPVLGADGEVVKIVQTAADVTDQTDEDLRRKALLAALDRSQAMVEFDLEGNILDANDLFLDSLGYTRAEVVGRHHSIFVTEEERSSDAYRAFWAKLGRGEFDSGRYQRVGKGGKAVHIQATYNPVLDASGRPVRVVKFAADITEAEVLAEEAACKSATFEQGSAPITLLSRDLVIQHINPAATELFMQNAESFGPHWSEFDAERLVGLSVRKFEAIESAFFDRLNDPANLPLRISLAVGGLEFDLRMGMVHDRRGEHVGYTMEWNDVTEASAATSLVDALDKRQAIIEFTPEGMVTTANAVFLDRMGYRLEEVVGEYHRIFVGGEEAQSAAYAGFWTELARGEHQIGEIERRTKSGERVFLQASYVPIRNSAGEVYKVVKVATDVTERVATHRQAELEQARVTKENEQVVTHLARGLKSLSEGDLSVELNDLFPEDYRQIRYDFNDAVSKLRAGEELRIRTSQEQEEVVTRLASALEGLSNGVLNQEIDDTFPRQYEQLRTDFNQAIARLREVMEAIVVTAETIQHGSGDISKGADDLSKRTENQAATLEETAAALDQITSTVRTTAEGAAEASRVASDTREEAQVSGEVVSSAVAAMGEIEKSSSHISQIITVIDDIAFQTNLLALNAGVEAARAGDAGRGFAVVAQEVRALAQRSSDAAKEIKQLISTSSEQVERGVDLVGRAGEALSAIVTRVESVTALVANIAESAKEQSTSLLEVNQAMNRMDEVTQENAAMVEQSTAASHRLAQSSAALIERVTHFDTGAEIKVAVTPQTNGDGEEPSTASVPAQPPVIQQREAAQAFFAGVGGAAEKFENLDDNWEEF
ncbi:methyl-accepting chemotaxis protein [Parvularcula maris]|uniref:methyl-accepting chemotaxis protein n=1 Tax=Parvularcula maris TaxID=2965077 RepID=UPI00351A83F1